MLIADAIPIPWRAYQALERARLRGLPWQPAPREFAFSQARDAVRLLAFGDVALTRIDEINSQTAFGALEPLLQLADLRTANLEAQLTSRTEPEGCIGSFVRADPRAVDTLRAARFDVLNVANNHALDFGAAGFAESLQHLQRAGIAACGVAGGDGQAQLAVCTLRDQHIGFLGFCDDHFPAQLEPQQLRPAQLDVARLQNTIATARAQVDVLVVQFHWGYEFALHPLHWQRDLARQAIEWGAQLVLCHHAHVPMAVERWKNGAIAHGLGNGLMRLSPYLTAGHPWTDRSIALEVELSAEGVHALRLHPLQLQNDWRVTPLHGAAARQLLAGLERMRRRLADTERLRAQEQARLAYETLKLSGTLRDTTQQQGLAERRRSLQLPRQQRLLEFVNTFCRVAASALENAAQNTDGTARRLYRWADALRARTP